MSDIIHNLKPLYRGDSREYTLSFTDKNGEPIPITGWKIYFTVKLNYWDSDDKAVIKKEITEHDDPINGKTRIILSPADTENIKYSEYYYDIQIKRATENILTVLAGRIKIMTDITQRRD